MIELDEQEGSYLEMCKHFRAIYDTKKIQDSPEDKRMVRNANQIPLLIHHRSISNA